MGAQRGRNEGVTGLVDFPSQSGTKFEVTVTKYKTRLDGASRDRRGRGGGVFGGIRWMFSSGSVVLTAKMRGDGWPAPDSWKGQTGTITVQVDTGKTIAYPVLVVEAGLDFDADKDDFPKLHLACRLTGAPTYAGWTGTQPAATDQSEADQIQWERSVKTVDPNGLQSSATRHIDIWGTLTDTDAAEQTKLLAVIAAASVPVTTPHNFKLRTSSFVRDALDGGTITEVWGLTTTVEDVVNSATGRTDDPSDLQDTETTAAFNGTPGAGTISGLVSRGITYKEYNDSNTLQVKHWGRRTTEQDITFPGTPVSIDKVTGTGGGGTGSTIALQSFKASTQVTANTTEPSWTPGGSPALKKRNWSFTQHTDAGKYVHRIEAGLTTVQEDQENQSSVINIDPSGLGTYEIHGRIVATSTTADPDVGSVTAGLTLYDRPTTEIHDNAYLRRFTYRPLNREEEIEHRGSSATGGTLGVLAPPSTIPSVLTSFDTVLEADTPQSLVQAAIATAQAVTTRPFRQISVIKNNKLRATTRTIVPTDDFKVFRGMPTYSEKHLATDATGLYVKVLDAVTMVSGKSKIYLGHHTHTLVRWPIILRRWRRTTNPDSLLYPGIVGTTCGDAGSGAVPGSVTLSGTTVSAVATGTGGSGYTTGAVGVVIVGGGGSGAIVTATTTTTSAVTGYVVVNAGTGYTSTPTVYVTGGATFLGVNSTCVVYRGGTVVHNLREEGVAHWVCIDYAFEVVAINVGGVLYNGTISNGSVPMDTVIYSEDAAPVPGATPLISAIDAGGATWATTAATASTGWGAFFGQ